ncbi:toxin-antitoxin system, antitoxin component, MerR domain protein [Bifidobacterium bifidum]|uniref:Toxin-antitoxin system, antitoxin component, MerR domain protein n=3 Tax=Bifidobacterium bifidum TaxID=1681 RepID=A0A133KRW7_BIFBI|nr:toxin-antitoxin system, antitoxin component, MerR domain protein [Bifidobacterium bifidum]
MVTYAMYQAKLEECYSLALTKQLRDAVQQTAILLSEGKSVTISATEQELTTEQAARTLGVSRQTLVRMLDKGLIPFSPPITSSQNPPDRLVGIRTGFPQPP